MFAHRGGMMDEGTAGETAEISNKGITPMCFITGWGRTGLGRDGPVCREFLELGASQARTAGCWQWDAPKRGWLSVALGWAFITRC